VLDSSGPAASFECALVRGSHARGGRLHFTACDALRVYRHLASGRYTFFARAIGPSGAHRAAVRHTFSIR
jgi:hypothetical protein